jgi:hypothetical protein
MKLPKKLDKTLCSALLTSLLLLGSLPAALKSSPQTLGHATDGLQMAIYIDQTRVSHSNVPRFRVELRTVGKDDLLLNLGLMLANGEKQYANNISLTLIGAQGGSIRMHLDEPTVIGGQIEPFVVPIPAGATFTLPVDLEERLRRTPPKFDGKLKPGKYAIEAQFTGANPQEIGNRDLADRPYWKSTVTSNRLQFEIPNQ